MEECREIKQKVMLFHTTEPKTVVVKMLGLLLLLFFKALFRIKGTFCIILQC